MTLQNDEISRFRFSEADRPGVMLPIEPFPDPREKPHHDLPEWEKPVVVKRPFWLANPINQLTLILGLLAAVVALIVFAIVIYL